VKKSGTNSFSQDLQTIYAAGVMGGLSDGQLVDRFLNSGGEVYFEALVHRHGPMVWGVCRRILSSHHDAEDAFQATFLVLARKARSIVPREMVANWLYGVANRTARKLRTTTGRRKAREKLVTTMPEPSAILDDGQWAEVRPLFDQELSRLPDRYRAPIVLCELEGKSHKEAAVQLGCPVGTLSGRLSRAKVMLTKRLKQQGVLAPGMPLILMRSQFVEAGVPATVMVFASKILTAVGAAGVEASVCVSARVTALAEGVLRTMQFATVKFGITTVFVGSMIALGGASIAYRTQAAERDQAQGSKEKAEAPAKTEASAKLDLEKLQGKWYRVASETDGKDWMPKGVDPKSPLLTVVFEGDKWRGMKEDGETLKTQHTIHLLPDRKPKQFMLGPPSGELTGAWWGIYKIENDKLTFCIQFNSNQPRPADFFTRPGDGRVLDVYKRAKD